MGSLVLISGLLHLVQVLPRSDLSAHVVVDALLLGSAGAGIIYGGYWHMQTSEIGDRFRRIFVWLLGTVLLFASVNTVALFIGSDVVTLGEFYEVMHLSVSIGAAIGLLVGTIEARAISQSEVAARAEARTAVLEREQRRILRINELLRHYVLNSLTVIGGYIENSSTAGRPDRSVVDERIDTIETLVEHVRAVSTALQHDSPETTYALDELVTATVRTIDPDQTVENDISPQMSAVRGGIGFERGIQLLFESFFAVLDPEATIRVTADDSVEGVSLVFSTGEGEVSLGDCLDNPGPEVDLKLTLASELFDSAGTVSFDESGGDCELLLTPVGDDAGTVERR